MAKGRPVTLVGLDIGTSKTAVIIAEAGSGSPKLIGAGMSPSLGLQKGVITGLDAAARSIRQALEQAEKTAGVKAASAYVSYKGAGIAVRDCQITFPAGSRTAYRGGNGRAAAVPSGPTAAGIPEDERVLQLIPSRIAPGHFGCRPESGARAITAPAGDIAGIIESVRLAGLAVQDIIYGPLAGAHVLLTPAERELGTLIVDIGAGATSVSIFYRGTIRETAVIPVGGEHLIGDLAIGLRTSLARAGEVLKSYSSMAGTGDPGELTIPAGAEGEESNTVSCDLVGEIVSARITEILDLIVLVIKSFDYPGLLPGGAVFSGGVSRLGGLALLAESRLQMPVRVSSLENTGLDLSPAYTNALGLVKCGFTRLSQNRHEYKNRRGQFTSRFLNWFQDRIKGDSRSLRC